MTTVTIPPAVTRTPLADLSEADLAAFLDERRQEYAALKARGLALDLTRGKPSSAQLDLADRLLELPDDDQGPRRARTCATTAGSTGCPSCGRSSPSCCGSSPSRWSAAATPA